MLRPIAFYADFLLYFLPLSHIAESSTNLASGYERMSMTRDCIRFDIPQ